MKRYFVKSHFSGWNEVSYKCYKSFVENIKKGALALSDDRKNEYIKTITRIVVDEENGIDHNHGRTDLNLCIEVKK